MSDKHIPRLEGRDLIQPNNLPVKLARRLLGIPHLHYEFRVGNEHRNPLTVALPAALPIPSDKLAAFRSVSAPLAAQLDMLRDTNLALLE